MNAAALPAHASEPPAGHIPSSTYSGKPTSIPNDCRSDKFRNDNKGNPKLIYGHRELRPGIHELHTMVAVEAKIHVLMHRPWPG